VCRHNQPGFLKKEQGLTLPAETAVQAGLILVLKSNFKYFVKSRQDFIDKLLKTFLVAP